MKYINHVTLNSGHVRETYPKEVDKNMFFILKRIYKESFEKDGAELFDGYKAKSIASEYGVLITVVNPDNVPVITTAISKNDDGSLWKILHSSASIPVKTSESHSVKLPYIADRVEIGAVMSIDAMKWTGDFSRCMGWLVLAPRKIR